MAVLDSLMVRIGVDAERVNRDLDKVDGFFERHAGKIAAAGAALGAAAGSAIATGVSAGLEKEAVADKLAAQLGATGPEAQRLGKIAGDLYSKGLGDGLETVSDAVRGVVANIEGMAAASDADLRRITASVINLGAAFDQDVGEVSRAVGKMLKTGLARDAQEALDILTRGFQTGANEANDLLDTFSEYSTQFRSMGLTGQQAMGLLSQGLKAGARDADVVADAIKEFSIEAVAGSDRIRSAYKELGINADQMFRMLGKGGPEAAKALDITLDRLRAVKDPVERNAIAVELFGTKAEDLGEALYALDPSSAVQALGEVSGAADKLGKTLNDNAQHGIEEWRRKTEQMLASLLQLPGPLGETAQAAAGMGQVLLPMGSDLGGLAVAAMFGAKALGGFAAGAAKAVVAGGRVAATWALMAARATAAAARMAASWVIAMGPVGWVITAVVALVALIVANWDKIKEATRAAWEWVGNKINSVWEWIKGRATAFKDWLGRLFTNFSPTRNFAAAWEWMRNAAINHVTSLTNWLRGLPNRILSAIGNLGNLLYNTGRNVVIGLWNGIAAAGSWLANQLWRWVKAVIPDPIERFLGIRSPSRLMAGIGGDVAAGLALGITDGADMVAKSAEELAAQAVPDMSAAQYQAPSAYGAATPSGVHAAAAGQAPTLVIQSDGTRVGDLLVEVLRQAVRVRGGNVQTVLGRA